MHPARPCATCERADPRLRGIIEVAIVYLVCAGLCAVRATVVSQWTCEASSKMRWDPFVTFEYLWPSSFGAVYRTRCRWWAVSSVSTCRECMDHQGGAIYNYQMQGARGTSAPFHHEVCQTKAMHPQLQAWSSEADFWVEVSTWFLTWAFGWTILPWSWTGWNMPRSRAPRLVPNHIHNPMHWL